MIHVLGTPEQVVRALLTYTDWWQPSTSSVMQVGRQRLGGGFVDGLPGGLLSSIEVHAELARRMSELNERERHVLFLWYVRQLSAVDIARAVGVSRRHCFRLRAAAVRKIVDAGETDRAA